MLSDDEIKDALVSVDPETKRLTQGFAQFARAIEAAVLAKLQAQEPCHHSIADARNKVVESGYICVKCGALFSAADHAPVQAQSERKCVHCGDKLMSDFTNSCYACNQKAAPVQVGINGLTKEETDASASVAGLTVQQGPVACKKLCELCEKRGYSFCANAAKITPLPSAPTQHEEIDPDSRTISVYPVVQEWPPFHECWAVRLVYFDKFGEPTMHQQVPQRRDQETLITKLEADYHAKCNELELVHKVNDKRIAELEEQNKALLEACKAALSDDQPYIEKCRAAIAAAEGK